MKILVDTSILVRSSQVDSPVFSLVRDSVARLPRLGFEGCLVPQVFYEYWVVATRPAAQNGLGLDAEQATFEMAQLASLFQLLKDERAIFEKWQELVTQYQVIGKQAHDTRLVAGMLRHGISHVLTLNPKDFQRYAEITIVTPQKVLEVTDDIVAN
ncbi:PIN domain-containing protein [Bremerella cremea]|uniref:PIN domain-containing protein n=1 Tax=Bremerella cremea TaxID=1031537 RepID=A0A368KZE7_9BACT|nr:PIN domain-containing protein [Bremerella cremea]RCS54872.1 PIN domain-containing protein [Bremerella cremea]